MQNENEIKKLAEEFTSGTFGTEIPHGYCFLTCYPLSILFDAKKINNSINYGNSPKDNGQVLHVWLTLDNNGTILDPTIRQFDPKMQSVYVGKLDETEVTKKFTLDDRLTSQELFDVSYDTWAAPLRNDQFRTPRPAGFEEKMNLINVKTATILYHYLNKIDTIDQLMQTEKCLFYFPPIFKFLRDKSSDKLFINSLRKSMPPDFESLLKKALSTN